MASNTTNCEELNLRAAHFSSGNEDTFDRMLTFCREQLVLCQQNNSEELVTVTFTDNRSYDNLLDGYEMAIRVQSDDLPLPATYLTYLRDLARHCCHHPEAEPETEPGSD